MLDVRFAVPDTTFNVAANIDATGLTSLVRVGLGSFKFTVL